VTADSERQGVEAAALIAAWTQNSKPGISKRAHFNHLLANFHREPASDSLATRQCLLQSILKLAAS